MIQQTNSDRLVASVSKLRDYLEQNRALSERSDLGVTSSFWHEMFSARSNFPDVNALIAFRRGDYGYGIGEERQGDEAAERKHFDRIASIIRHSVPDEFVRNIPEPLFGAPYLFDYRGCARSASFLLNAATAWHITEQARTAGIHGNALDVCEIGPGWGACAYLLHHALPIRSYTLVDLPQNLLISGVYVSNTRPELKLETVEVAGAPIEQAQVHALRAVLPGALERFRCSFDLIVNSFSLQEMEKATVERYMQWILSHLAPAGVFVSINSHGKAGVKLPHEYGFERFEIRHLSAFRKFPSGFFNTIPYAATLAPRNSTSPNYSPKVLDVLCALMQLGLTSEIQKEADAFAAGTLMEEDLAWLLLCEGFFRGRRNADGLRALEEMRPHAPRFIVAYLEAQLRLMRGEPRQAASLLRTAAPFLHGFALTRAATIAGVVGTSLETTAPLDAKHAYPEVEPLLNKGDIGAFARHFESVAAPFGP